MHLTLVPEVSEVRSGWVDTHAQVLFLEAKAVAGTLGWSNPILRPTLCKNRPADGVKEYEFLATPPAEQTPAVRTEMSAFLIIDEKPDWMTGVRIKGSGNGLESKLLPLSPPIFLIDCKNDPEPSTAIATRPATVRVEESVDTTSLRIEAVETSVSIVLLKISDIPEVISTVTGQRRDVLGKSIEFLAPRVYKRTYDLLIEVEVCWPGSVDIGLIVTDCAKQAVATGVFTNIIAGDIGVIAATFESYLRTCLIAKGVSIAASVRSGLARRKVCSSWERFCTDPTPHNGA